MADARRLLGWFGSHARDLPWRHEPREPYAVLVSELMLQQTQVERVVPCFEAFVRTFPSVEALAAAPVEAVLEAWSGLGYYRRARLLHEAARQVSAAGAVFPESAAELERLPGVGPYTAAAVASLAFGEPCPVLDGNVLRVGARVLALGGSRDGTTTRGAVRAWVQGLMAESGATGPVNEALMELGATLCTPRSPSCPACPLAGGCRAFSLGRAEDYPPPRPRREIERLEWVAACCVAAATGRWLLREVSDGPVLLGLWLPPLFAADGAEDPVEAARRAVPLATTGGRLAAPVRHSITFRRIRVRPVRLEAPEEGLPAGSGWRWADPAAPGLATSSLLGKLVRALHEREDPR